MRRLNEGAGSSLKEAPGMLPTLSGAIRRTTSKLCLSQVQSYRGVRFLSFASQLHILETGSCGTYLWVVTHLFNTFYTSPPLGNGLANPRKVQMQITGGHKPGFACFRR